MVVLSNSLEFRSSTQTSCVRTPQQNGIAERKNGPILAIPRALMLQMNVS
jgi:hypothetical protein